MKTFTPDAIFDRIVKFLKNKEGWPRVLADSTVVSLLKAHSESNAEAIRYFEYLMRESKWKYSKNITSLLSQSDYLGYKPKRKTSSIGELIISHDPNLMNAGITDIFSEEDLTTLTPYALSGNINFPVGTRFSNGSIEFISTKEASYTPGLKYLKIPVIQGVQKSFTTVTPALGNPFEVVRIIDPNIESASDPVSSQFFSVKSTSLNTTVSYIQYDSILLSEETEYAYEVSSAKDYSFIDIKFGDGVSGKILPKDSVVSISYLETLGSLGNVEELFTINKIVSSTPIQMYCSNFVSIAGGSDEDTIDDIRAKAPRSYLIGGSIITEDAYKYAIESIPDIYKAVVYSGTYFDPISNLEKEAILYSAITNSGDAPTSLIEEQLLERTIGKKSPLDFSHYEEPKFLHIKTNIMAKSQSKDLSAVTLVDSIVSGVVNKYGTLSQNFKQQFDYSEFLTYIRNNFLVKNATGFIEAVIDLKPSEFEKDTILGYYRKGFIFDRSFKKLKGFNNNVLHCLKINVIFDCVECENSSRTLLFFQNEDYDPMNPLSYPYVVKQYPLITNITSYDFITNNVLLENMQPDEIIDTDPDYIPFRYGFDYDSISGDNLDALGEGWISIPVNKPNSSEPYVNFVGATGAELDSIIRIEVIAEPFNFDIFPYYDNNIIKLGEEDILVEVTYE